jgi:molybdate transport system substrate-binding protein
MPFTRRGLWAALLAFCALAVMEPANAKPKANAPLRVFAASSLTDAMNELGDLYAAKGHPKPVFNYAASSALARQIEQGAQADFFISADEPWMDYVAERKLIEQSTRKSFLINRLVLVAPVGHPLNVKIGANMDLYGALNGGKLAMADPDSVPAGKYGRAALQNLGVWSSVEGSVVRAENVRAALRFVELGEAAGGVVYLTDQMAAKGKVALVGEFPAVSHPRISYPMAVVRGGASAEAKTFEKFLQSSEARAVFTRLGFIIQ